MPKGWEWLGSPDWNIDRTFTSTFYFPQKIKKNPKNKPAYRNPIYLAKEYKGMIDSGKVKNQAELARKLGVSSARVTQILNILKLDSRIIQELEKHGNPLESKIINERILRSYVNKFFRKQKNLVKSLTKSLFKYSKR